MMVLALAACSRSQPNNFGLNVGQTGSGPGDGEGGPVTPGSAREFSVRVGDTIHFLTDSTEISSESQQTLTAQARWLNQYPQYRIMIEGHADERGTREYNIGLGAKRAANTKQFLISQGVNPRRIQTISYGRERPVALCSDITCWQQNRRAVTVLNGNPAYASN